MLDTSTLSRDDKDINRLPSQTSIDEFFLPSYKVLIIGDPCIGKTSLVWRYVFNKFIEDPTTSLGLDYQLKKVQVTPTDKIILKLWDTAGSEKFHSIAQNYFTNCDGIILCFDNTDKNTFNNLYGWINYINNYVKIIEKENKIDENKEIEEEEEEDEEVGKKIVIKWFEKEQIRGPIIVLAGTKADLKGKKVNEEDIDKLKKYLNCEYFETSSKDGNGVEDLFFFMAKELFENIDKNKNKEESGFKLENKRINEDQNDEDENCNSKLSCC